MSFNLDDLLKEQGEKVDKTIEDKIKVLKEEIAIKPTALVYDKATFLFHKEISDRLDKLIYSKELEAYSMIERANFRGFKTRFINVAISDALDKYEEENGEIKVTLFTALDRDTNYVNSLRYIENEDVYELDINGDIRKEVDEDIAILQFNGENEGNVIRSLDELLESKRHTSKKMSKYISRAKQLKKKK